MLTHWAEEQHEFAYSKQDFEKVRRHLIKLTGIKLADSKDAMVYSRLVRRVRILQLGSIAEYLDYMLQHPVEDEHFINALTTNLTSFFREPHHFDILEHCLKEASGAIRIWCAAASTGEEPYSIAMTVAKVFGRFDTNVEIIASDVNSDVLETAQQGVYPESRVQSLEMDWKKQFFHKGKGRRAGMVKVVPELRQMIEFKKINLLDADWPITSPIDIIFCRNVMIYFDRETQIHLLSRMVKLLSPDGLYVAGHSENFSHLAHLVTGVGKTTYKSTIFNGLK